MKVFEKLPDFLKFANKSSKYVAAQRLFETSIFALPKGALEGNARAMEDSDSVTPSSSTTNSDFSPPLTNKKGDITMTRKQLEKRFSLYPDVVTLQEFRQMLGGIGDKTARKLVRENRVKHFYIRNTYLIPKNHVIDYLLSTHYEKYRRRLKAHL